MAESKEFSTSGEGAASLDALALDAAKGNEESFSRLVKHFTPALLSMIAPLSVPPTEKEDLVQEGLIGLYKAVRLFDPSLSSFGTFARVCMRSSLADVMRRYHRVGTMDDIADLEETLAADPSQSPERILMEKIEWQEIMKKVDRTLSPLERRVFGLNLQGRTASQIAEAVGKDKKSVENTLYRLRRKLSSPELFR